MVITRLKGEGARSAGIARQRRDEVQRSSRKRLVGVIALVGIILIVLGVVALQELLVVGKVPPERLGRQVVYTIIPLMVGLWLIIWCLVAGMAWARGVQTETTTGETRSSGRA